MRRSSHKKRESDVSNAKARSHVLGVDESVQENMFSPRIKGAHHMKNKFR